MFGLSLGPQNETTNHWVSFMLSGTKVRLGSSFLNVVVHGECFQLSNHDIVMHEKSGVYYLITH